MTGSSKDFSHGDREWTNQGPSCHRGQPAMHAGNLTYIRVGAVQGDVADRDWPTHCHRGRNPRMILIHDVICNPIL